ncbi:ribosome biogenesis protein Nop16-domain-containing protein [Lactarius sanguifluus]|nr:ribosome biogenesis protein Nop16-domain-containing protein [Lactarius sanguifluus]
MVVDTEFVGSVESHSSVGPDQPAGNRLPDLARDSFVLGTCIPSFPALTSVTSLDFFWSTRPMANPRQRRKARSSQQPVRHSRQAKKLLKKQPPIRGPKALRDAWDKHKTVRQNYAALGLAASLNPRASGGAERAAPVTQARTATNEVAFINGSEPAPLMSGGGSNGAPSGLGRITRDETGQVVAIETGDDIGAPLPTRERDLVEEPAAILPSECHSWISFGHMPGTEDPIIRVHSVPVVSRFSSKGEVTFLQKLISRHGSDVEAMARDRKLNPDQRTEGEIRRAIRRASGG